MHRIPAALLLALVPLTGCAGTGPHPDETTAVEATSYADSPIQAQLEAAAATIDAIVSRPVSERTFENSVKAIDDLQARTFMESRMTTFMGDVSPDAETRATGREAAADLSNWFDELYKNHALYEVLLGFEPLLGELEPLDALYLSTLLRDYRRNGMGLKAEDRARLLEIDRSLTDLGIEFRAAISDDETVVFFTPEESRGVPQRYLDNIPQAGGLYKVSLKGAAPGYYFSYCEVPASRQKLSLSYGLRAGSPNVTRLERMLSLRAEQARILGYESFAHFQTETRMSQHPDKVNAFYDDLRPKLRRKALADLAEYTAAKREHTGDPDAQLYAWDISFYRNSLLRDKYAVDTQLVREYFPMAAVTQGMFDVYQDLFGIRFTKVDQQAWHADVTFYQVHDQQTGDLLGEFYLDLHPRPGKYSHAAQFPLTVRKRWMDGELTLPRVALVCNFTKPTATQPSLMTHDEVETYFHEFGHCLHSILTEVELYEFAGTSVARDFVEAPSQMLENWVWRAEVLGRFARHYETGEPLPAAVIAGMVAAKNLGSGLNTEGQVYLGMYDFAYHSDPSGEVDTTAVREAVYAETRLFPVIENLHAQASFGHLVGYEASYYGYLWSLVYASDMFSRFEAEGIMNPQTARDYRRTVLARGGTVPALQMVTEFLGREPNADAFLKHLGLN